MIKSLVLPAGLAGVFEAIQPTTDTLLQSNRLLFLFNVDENVRNSWDSTYFSYINNVLVTKFKVSISMMNATRPWYSGFV